MKFKAVLISVLTGLFLAGAAFAQNGKAPVVKVNGHQLGALEYGDSLNEIVPMLSFHGNLSQETMDKYRPKVIEKMVENELFYREALRLRMKPSSKWVKEQKKETIERVGGKGNFAKALASQGVSEKDYERFLVKKYLVQEFIAREVRKKAEVSEGEALKYYEANKGDFMRPEARRIRQILIEVDPGAPEEEKQKQKELAAQVLEKARAGADFPMLAWDYSTDKFKFVSGDLGLVHRGRLLAEIEDVAFRMEVGQISDVIETIYGYHIIRVEEKKDPEQLEFEDMKHKIMTQLTEKRGKELREAILARLKAEARVEISE